MEPKLDEKIVQNKYKTGKKNQVQAKANYNENAPEFSGGDGMAKRKMIKKK